MILERRFIDLRGKDALILGVRLSRIEMFRALGKRRIENALPTFAGRIGIVLLAATSGERQQEYQEKRANTTHGGECNVPALSLTTGSDDEIK